MSATDGKGSVVHQGRLSTTSSDAKGFLARHEGCMPNGWYVTSWNGNGLLRGSQAFITMIIYTSVFCLFVFIYISSIK